MVMSDESEVEGRLGDVSGRLGDVSGRLGDVSGRLGDISGKIGDVSGEATFEEVRELLIQDRRAHNLGCLERRVALLEFEVVALARWAELRFGPLAKQLKGVKESVAKHGTDLKNHDDRLKRLEAKPPVG
jgi:hypothetical protein